MSKKVKLILGGALLAITFAVFIFANGNSSTLNASQTTEQEIENTLKGFFKSIDDKDPDKMISYTVDVRFSDDDVRKAEYKALLSTDKVKLKEIESIKKIDDKTYRVTTQIYTKDNGDITKVFPVTQDEDGKWKVTIGEDYVDVPAK